jgi:Ni/Co efflux regulator RcnB
MSKICYDPSIKFNDEKLDIITLAEIVGQYEDDGYDLTLRQLYYQFISRDYFPNNEKNYDRLGDIISDARLAGMISWQTIEDRTRHIVKRTQWDSPASILEVLENSYHIDMWENQTYRPEVWVEKEALVGIVAAACQPLDVTYLACKGYVSQSQQWRNGQRLGEAYRAGQIPVVFYLGDHDPSGIDMTNDHIKRLKMFTGIDVPVERLALSMDQVRKYNPPPNPAKMSDSRAKKYVAQYGKSSWELDALEPDVMVEIITDAIMNLRDERAHHLQEQKREKERANLAEAVRIAKKHLGDRDGIVDIEDL